MKRSVVVRSVTDFFVKVLTKRTWYFSTLVFVGYCEGSVFVVGVDVSGDVLDRDVAELEGFVDVGPILF